MAEKSHSGAKRKNKSPFTSHCNRRTGMCQQDEQGFNLAATRKACISAERDGREGGARHGPIWPGATRRVSAARLIHSACLAFAVMALFPRAAHGFSIIGSGWRVTRDKGRGGKPGIPGGIMNIQRQFSFPDLELRRKKTTAQMGGSLKDASNRQGFRWLAFAIVLCGTVISQAPATYADFFSKGLMAPFRPNWPPAFVCFGAADMVAQACERYSRQDAVSSLYTPASSMNWARSIDLRRILVAGIVGIICNGTGSTIWLFFLNSFIPAATIGIDTPYRLARLVCKAFTHNLAWGFLSNSLSLFLRRLATGEGLGGSFGFWQRRIVSVTYSNFFFWPAVMVLNFAFFSESYQVIESPLPLPEYLADRSPSEIVETPVTHGPQPEIRATRKSGRTSESPTPNPKP